MKCLECPKQVYVNIGRSTVRSAKTIRKKLATPCVYIFRLPNETLTVCRPRTRGSQLRQQPCPPPKQRAKNPPEQGPLYFLCCLCPWFPTSATHSLTLS